MVFLRAAQDGGPLVVVEEGEQDEEVGMVQKAGQRGFTTLSCSSRLS